MDHLDRLMAYENGELGTAGTLYLFSDLVDSGLAWSLQGHYGRTAARLIGQGWLLEDGTLTPAAHAAIDADEES